MTHPVCASCGARILWARTTNGKAMPINPMPDAGGNVQLVQGGTPEGGLLARVLTNDERAAHRGVLHISHFATCPNRQQHRKP